MLRARNVSLNEIRSSVVLRLGEQLPAIKKARPLRGEAGLEESLIQNTDLSFRRLCLFGGSLAAGWSNRVRGG